MYNATTQVFAIFLMLITLSTCSHRETRLEKVSQDLHKVRKIPLADFFKNPTEINFQLSPNGKMVSCLRPYRKRFNIFVMKRGQPRTARRLTSVMNRDIREYFWKNDHTIVYFRDNKGDENFHVYSVDINSPAKTRDLTPFPKVKAVIVDQQEETSQQEILIGLNKRDPEVFDVYQLNIATGKLSLVVQNPGKVTGWLTDHKGVVRLAIDNQGTDHVYLYRDNNSEPFKEVLRTSYRDAFHPLVFTSDNMYVYALSNLGRDKKALVRFDLKKAKELDKIYENSDYDLEDIYYSIPLQKLTGAIFVSTKEQWVFFERRFEQLFKAIKDQLPDPNFQIDLTGHTKNEDAFIFRALTDRNWGSVYEYDVKTAKLTKLTDIAPWLHEEELSKMQPIEYRSRDGLTIHGYLTLPKGREAKNLPVIIHPHGGPWSRNEWYFDPEVQFLANRGYAVFQMNFRGSTGYGRKFWEASFKQWGKKMQDDISDGAKWLIDEGIADPKKVAIYGGSYGGYATLAGLAFTPELYACGIDYVGISNLFSFLKTMPQYWKPYLKMWYEEVGDPEKEQDLIRQASPLFSADRIRAPLFVAQGAHDPRVNINESNQIVESLRKRRVPVEYMVKENEGHGFRNEENRLDFHMAMEKFLAKCL